MQKLMDFIIFLLVSTTAALEIDCFTRIGINSYVKNNNLKNIYFFYFQNYELVLLVLLI